MPRLYLCILLLGGVLSVRRIPLRTPQASDACPYTLALNVEDISFSPPILIRGHLTTMKIIGSNTSPTSRSIVSLAMVIAESDELKIAAEVPVEQISTEAGADFQMQLSGTPMIDWPGGLAHYLVVLNDQEGKEIGCFTGSVQVANANWAQAAVVFIVFSTLG